MFPDKTSKEEELQTADICEGKKWRGGCGVSRVSIDINQYKDKIDDKTVGWCTLTFSSSNVLPSCEEFADLALC